MPKGISISGKIVRELRHKRHFTQATLANAIGVSVETIKRIEKTDVAEVLIELIPKLAAALETQTEAIEVGGGASPTGNLVTWVGQFKSLAEAERALREAWSKAHDGKLSRKAAKKT